MTDLKARVIALKREIARSKTNAEGMDAALKLMDLLNDLLARIEELENGIPAERQRCVDILNAARSGAIDSDLRCIRAWIEDGSEAPKEND